VAIIANTEGHYTIRAYVSPDDVHTMGHVQGRVTFSWIYRQRPKTHRYAIASEWDANVGESFIVWDLFHVWKGRGGRLITPKPRLTHFDYDAALMATIMLYDRRD
jgi:hypothetical protein